MENVNRLKKKVRQFIRKPYFYQLKTIFEKIPLSPIKISKFYILILKDFQNSQIKRKGYGRTRIGTPADIGNMCLLENKREIFSHRFKTNQACLIAENDETLLGYLWFSSGRHYIEETCQYRITVPANAVYAFDAFIAPRYRMRGVWVLLQMAMIAHINTRKKNTVIIAIDYGNNGSIISHARFGYTFMKEVVSIQIFNNYHFIEKNIEHKKGDYRAFMI
jgi:L-amino acid N-acyltransferase YncA